MITIVITAYKEWKTIGGAIEAVLENDISEQYEILVLAPDKQTLEVAEQYAKKFKQIKVIKDKGEGKPSALNIAFEKAKGRILILTDGDVNIGKNSINFLLKKFQNPETGAVTGRPISINNRKKMLGFWAYILSDVAHKRRLKALNMKRGIFCSGYLFAFRRGIFSRIPTEFLDDGYMSHLVYEAGYKIDYAPEAKVYVKYPTTFKDWIIQKKRNAGGYNQIKMAVGKEIRSFKKESLGILDVLKYPKNLKEISYLFALILARLYLWFVIFIDINIKKKGLKEIWLRIESTK